MKPLIFPLTTLIAMSSWYFVNNQKISDLNESLNQSEVTNSPLQEVPVNDEKSFIGLGGDLELEKVGSFLTKVSQGKTKSNGGNAWLWTEQQLSLMGTDRLLELLNELENSEFPPQERGKMEYEILDTLRRKSPENYLQHVGIKPGFSHNNSASAFRQLIKNDTPAAIAWFDEHSTKTNLSEKEAFTNTSALVTFEKIIAEKLYPDQLEALTKRLQKLHNDQVSSILRSLETNSKTEIPQHYFNLVRANLSEHQATSLVSNAMTNLARNKKLPEIAQIIEDHPLTPLEKTAFYKNFASNFAWNSGGKIKQFETILPFLKQQGIEASAEVYAKGVSQFYSDDLSGTGDLTSIYRYVQETGESQNLPNLLSAFTKQTTSRFCECCCLEGRLSRISDENLKTQISAAHQQNLDSSK